MFDADAKPSIPPESPPRELGPERRGAPLLSTLQVIRWTLRWVFRHERMAYFKCLACVAYLAAFAFGFPYALLVLFEEALGDGEMADATSFAVAGGALVAALVLQAQVGGVV
jgi:hypothetical protein